MSATLVETERVVAQVTLVRTFAAELVEDGRTLEALCVPFNTRATVADPPDFQPYEEMFLEGAFRNATKAPNRVLLDFEHHLGIGNVLGHGIELEERTDGLYGKFRIAEHTDGDKALALVRDKVLTGMSVMFKPLRTVREGNVAQRVKVHLDRVSLCRYPAYEASQVLAVRTRVHVEPVPLPEQALVARLESLGIRVPDLLRTPMDPQMGGMCSNCNHPAAMHASGPDTNTNKGPCEVADCTCTACEPLPMP